MYVIAFETFGSTVFSLDLIKHPDYTVFSCYSGHNQWWMKRSGEACFAMIIHVMLSTYNIAFCSSVTKNLHMDHKGS